ncbi:MAG TPA: 2,3-diphosphoglycerate synthetase [Actinomycetota bacterium]|nr:2,3-diphosphoglycerate synthetase [Actinomycetota bacterium]
MTRSVVLIDGEHYPPVTQQGVDAVRARGYEVVAAVFCGGGEKLSRALELGEIPIVRGESALHALDEALSSYAPDVVVDLSDDPVVDHAQRMRLASIALARNVAYEAPGFRMDPPPRPRVARVPSIAILGTGKRCGKTAVSAHVARTLKAAGLRPVIVAMGRGGPDKPLVVRGDLHPPTAESLIALAEAGNHAASDVYEDAVVAGVPAIGARRAAAGPAGQTAFDTVSDAVEAAHELEPDVILLEGSGTAIPPVHADATILVARDTDDLGAWPGSHRLLLADLLVVRMTEGKVVPTEDSALTSPNRVPSSVVRVNVALRPTPLGPVEGRRIYAATTAPPETGDALRDHLERTYGANVIGVTHHLADRARLETDLRAVEGRYEILAVELKAAAIDVAARVARQGGAEIVFVDNRPIGIGHALEDEIAKVEEKARQRFEDR